MCNCQQCESVEFETDYTAQVTHNCGFTGKVQGIATGFLDSSDRRSSSVTTLGEFWFTCPQCGVEVEIEEIELTFGGSDDF
jgi:predicted RNA-binding Zn-ribbon protein involved in translation (DUF1610 family)